MHFITSRYQEEETHFKDIDALGLFVDNHDNARFLSTFKENNVNSDIGFTNALVFSMTARGIPFFYYGSERNFDGGKDPANREPFWECHGQGSSEAFISDLMYWRKTTEMFNYPFEEKTVTDNLYAFQRGQVLVALTN